MSAFANIRRPATFAVAIAATVGLAACGGGRERPRADVAASQVTTIGVNSYLWRAALDGREQGSVAFHRPLGRFLLARGVLVVGSRAQRVLHGAS